MSDSVINIDSLQGKSKKSILIKLLFVFVNVVTIGTILIIEFRKGEIKDFSAAMQTLSNNLIWLLLALCVFAVKFFSDALCYYILIKDTTGESRLPLSMKVCLIGRYGDGITPMGTGGQPFQIYFLHKYNIELSKSASIPLSRVTIKVIGYNVCMLFFFIFFSQEGSGVIKTAAYVALFINSLGPIIILFFAFNRKTGLKLADFFIGLGYRFKMIKDLEQAKVYWLKKVDDMLLSIRYFSTKPAMFFSLFALSVIEIIALTSVPYFVFRAFGGDTSVSWIFMTTSAMYVMSASIIAPTPGTSGVAEASFYGIFERVILGGMMFYALITWRIITFYTFIIGGAILLIYESIYKKKAYVDARDESKGRVTNRQRKLEETIKQEKLKRLNQANPEPDINSDAIIDNRKISDTLDKS